MVKIILCTDAIGNIGRNNDLLFKMKEDMRFFKKTTEHSIVIMGYNTWLSLGEKPLPNRINIILTNEEIAYTEKKVFVSNDLKKLVENHRSTNIDNDLFIIGGAYVYNQALEMNLVDEILITVVPIEVQDADTRVNLKLMERFNKRKIIETFVNENGIKVTIEKWNK